MPDTTFQDDQREKEMISLFNMVKDETEGRSGIDAHLYMDDLSIPFELKTSSKGSVTTVRDFGPDHIKKWKNKHWLFGFYKKDGIYYKCGSPSMMEPWIREKEIYISTDFGLADILSKKLSLDDLEALVGKKQFYSLNDAKKIQKRQYSSSQYRELSDHPNGYTPSRMLEILSGRARYIIERGSTLNNPHIPAGYFNNLPSITKDHPETIRALVRSYLSTSKS
jgi:hypothetical protein